MAYVDKICDLRGTTDTGAVTLSERIDFCVKENSAKCLRGNITREDFDNYSEFTQEQLDEYCLRAVRGAMSTIAYPCFTASIIVTNNGASTTDTQLDTVFTNVSWYIIKMIGQGSL